MGKALQPHHLRKECYRGKISQHCIPSIKTTAHIGDIKSVSKKEIADGCGEETFKKALFPNHLLKSPKNIRVEHGYDAEVKYKDEKVDDNSIYLRCKAHLQQSIGRTQLRTSLRVFSHFSTTGSQTLVQRGSDDKQK